MPPEEFDMYIDLLNAVARTVGEEHTLKMPGIGAFWNMLGSMAEIQLPVFVLENALRKAYATSYVELLERCRKSTIQAAAKVLMRR